jgi:Cu-processing system ATP-binding protein
MIVARGVTKRYGTARVLRGIDLTIARGRVTAILGPNGAGKTTFIKLLLGLTRPSDGELLVGGVRVGTDASYRARIGYMPQIAHMPENLTGNELLGLLRNLRGVAATDDRLIDQLALRESLDKKLRTLSGGTRQKLNAVAAFLFGPDLFVLDEPTTGLDPVSSGILKRRIAEEQAASRTIVFTSHILSEVDELADDVVFVNEGRVEYVGGVLALKEETGQSTTERAIAAVMLRKCAA